jgi:hypothetical protein
MTNSSVEPLVIGHLPFVILTPMLFHADLLRLPYDDTLTRAGVEYAKKSLHYTYNRMHLPPGPRLRKIVAGVAVELAFRRWLDANEVPYDLHGVTAFTEKDKYDLRLGGRRVDLKSFFLTDREAITALRRDPGWLLDAEALVPEDQLASAKLDDGDVYVFGFLTGLEARQQADTRQAEAAGQPLELVATLADDVWLGRSKWRTLGALALKSNCGAPLELEVGGQARDRGALAETLILPPGTRVVAQHRYYALLYLRAFRAPEAEVGVHSPNLQRTHVVRPVDWHNIWVYGMDVFVAGWLTKGELLARGRRLPAGARVKQYPRTQTANRSVLVQDLRPVAELAARIKAFAGRP